MASGWGTRTTRTNTAPAGTNRKRGCLAQVTFAEHHGHKSPLILLLFAIGSREQSRRSSRMVCRHEADLCCENRKALV